MFRCAFWAVIVAFVIGSVGASAEPMLRILEPADNASVRTGEPIPILWDSNYGDDTRYFLSYSRDGKTFGIPIASGIHGYESAWTPTGPLDVRGWVKVKAYGPNGLLKAESVSEVSLIPRTAIVVSKHDQRVFHFVDGALKQAFICSTARPQYDLDPGVYHVYSRQPRHWSREYKVWMNHSLFFHDGYALHATTMVRQLGRPASHGCIRLRPRDAAKLYSNVAIGTPVIVLPKSKACSFLLDQAKNTSRKPVQTALAERG